MPSSRRRSSRTARPGNRFTDEPVIPFRRVGSRSCRCRARSLRTASRPDGANGDRRFRPHSLRRRERRRDIGLRPRRFGVADRLTTAFKAVTVPRNRWATGNSLVPTIGGLGVRHASASMGSQDRRLARSLLVDRGNASGGARRRRAGKKRRGPRRRCVQRFNQPRIPRPGDSCPWRP